MSSSELKIELKRLIELEDDVAVLDAIKVLLERATFNPSLKEKLTRRASQAEEDIQQGRIFTREDVAKRVR